MNVAAMINEKGEPRQLRGVLESEKEISRDQAGTKLGLSSEQHLIMKNLILDQGITELMAVTCRTNRIKFRNQLLMCS